MRADPRTGGSSIDLIQAAIGQLRPLAEASAEEMSVVDLMTFLDVCQLYLQTRRKSRSLCTLWAIITFIRTEDTSEFVRWCHAYTVPHLRYRKQSVGPQVKEKPRVDKLILQHLQELFNCGCIPSCDIGL